MQILHEAFAHKINLNWQLCFKLFRRSVGGKDNTQNKCSLIFHNVFEIVVISHNKSFFNFILSPDHSHKLTWLLCFSS